MTVLTEHAILITSSTTKLVNILEMWANAKLMVALPNIGGALYSTSQSLADVHYYAAKTLNQYKFGGVPQTNEMISAASGPKFTIL